MALKIKFDVTRTKYQEAKDSIAAKIDEMILDQVVMMTQNKDPERPEARKQPAEKSVSDIVRENYVDYAAAQFRNSYFQNVPSLKDYTTSLDKYRYLPNVKLADVRIYGTRDLVETAKVEEVVQDSLFMHNKRTLEERVRNGQHVVICPICKSVTCPNTYYENCEIAGLQS